MLKKGDGLRVARASLQGPSRARIGGAEKLPAAANINAGPGIVNPLLRAWGNPAAALGDFLPAYNLNLGV